MHCRRVAPRAQTTGRLHVPAAAPEQTANIGHASRGPPSPAQHPTASFPPSTENICRTPAYQAQIYCKRNSIWSSYPSFKTPCGHEAQHAELVLWDPRSDPANLHLWTLARSTCDHLETLRTSCCASNRKLLTHERPTSTHYHILSHPKNPRPPRKQPSASAYQT